MIKKNLPEQNIPGYSATSRKPVNDVLQEVSDSDKEDLTSEQQERLLKICNFAPKQILNLVQTSSVGPFWYSSHAANTWGGLCS